MFRRTLKGEYEELLKGSIHSFDELKEKFCGAFIHLVQRKTDNGALLNIKQKELETLRQYIKRFNETL